MIKIFKYLKPYTKSIIIGLVLLFSQVITELFLPKLMAQIVDKGIATGNTPYVFKIGGLMILVAIVCGACAVGNNYFMSRVSMGVGRDLRKSIFTHVESLSHSDVNKIGTPSLITRTTNDVMQVQNFIMMGLRMMLFAPLMCIGGIIMAVSENAKLSNILVIEIPILIVIIVIIMVKTTPLFSSIQTKIDNLNQVLRENLNGIRVIRAFNQIKTEEKRFDKANTELKDISVTVGKIMSGLMPLMMILFNLTTVAVMYFGSVQINKGTLAVGSLMAFIQYAMTILFSLTMAAMMFVMIPRAQASAVRFNEVMELMPTIKEPDNPQPIHNVKGIIEYDHVTFTYPGAEQPVLKDVTFTTNPGEVTAIIGGTGYGKSTLINLIPRFYDVSSGTVKIDGIDVRDISLHDLHMMVGYVPQKAFLFGNTIAENIRYAKADATDDEIVHALTIAQAMEFVSQMKDGIESVISQAATNISGGQKQRLSIARAIVRKPKIYIFDDSFSALDFKTDARLRAALRDEIKDSSVLLVAQRVATIMDADRIIVLDDGCVAGIGTHKELMSSCSVYKEIVSSQLSEEEIA